MATTKKVVKKKSVAAKTTKKAAPKKSTKPVSTTRKTTKASTATSSFWQVKFTINTVYWLIIGAAVLTTAFITYNTHVQLNNLYDAIDAENARIENM